jgi:hypothetical protein
MSKQEDENETREHKHLMQCDVSDIPLHMESRLDEGEAWCICGECGIVIFKFDGHSDKISTCQECREYKKGYR